MNINFTAKIFIALIVILSSAHLAHACGACEAAGIQAEKASKTASSLKDVSTKASKFTKVFNAGLTTFSTYVYGITATMAVIDMIWPGVIPETEPAYVAEIRAYFAIMQDEFRIVKDQITDLKLYVQERTSVSTYSDYILDTHAMEAIYIEYMDARENDELSADVKAGYTSNYLVKYDELAGGNADRLFIGLTTGDANLNIATNAIEYTKGNRSKVLEIMFEMFNVITMGVKHESLKYALQGDPTQIDILNSRWESRMDTLQQTMKDIDNQLVNDANNRMELDFEEEIPNLKDNNKTIMAGNLYDWFSAKFYWQDWLVLVYSKDVKGKDNHAYVNCKSQTVFRKRHSGSGKTVYLFHIDKARGSWMTKAMATNELKGRRYSWTETCRSGRRRYTCTKTASDLTKIVDAIRPDVKVCSITKGVVILRKTKSYGIHGDGRILSHYSQAYFNVFAVGMYGASSPQESVEGYSINGGWTSYTAYTSCSVTCGGGTQSRRRYCRNPTPQDGGRSCIGAATQTRNCNTLSCFSKTFLTNEIKKKLQAKKSMSNEDFAKHLRDYLKNLYTDYRFSVNVYNSIKGGEKHSYRGTSVTALFRTQGRNTVVGWTKKCPKCTKKDAPNSSTRNEIKDKVLDAIVNYKKDADKSRDKAWEVLQSEGYRIAMVLVVRHGNGLRSSWFGNGIFFENFKCKGNHKSSIVVMLGDAKN